MIYYIRSIAYKFLWLVVGRRDIRHDIERIKSHIWFIVHIREYYRYRWGKIRAENHKPIISYGYKYGFISNGSRGDRGGRVRYYEPYPNHIRIMGY